MRRGWRASAARLSESMERVTCASVTPTPWKISRSQWNGFASGCGEGRCRRPKRLRHSGELLGFVSDLFGAFRGLLGALADTLFGAFVGAFRGFLRGVAGRLAGLFGRVSGILHVLLR